MSPVHMLPGQISPLQLESVEDGPRTLPLKFGQNWVSIWLHLNPEGWWVAGNGHNTATSAQLGWDFG